MVYFGGNAENQMESMIKEKAIYRVKKEKAAI